MKKETRLAVKYSLIFVFLQILFLKDYEYYGIDFYMALAYLAYKYILKPKPEGGRNILDDIYTIVYGGAVLRFLTISTILFYKWEKTIEPLIKRKYMNYFMVHIKEPIPIVLMIFTAGFGLIYFSKQLKVEKTSSETKQSTVVVGVPAKEEMDKVKVKIARKQNR